MPRPKKASDTLNCKVEKQISDKLIRLCEETGLSKTKVVEKALIQYIERYQETGKI